MGIERRYCYGRKKEEQCRNIRTGKKRVSKAVYDTRTGGTDEKKDRRSKSRKTDVYKRQEEVREKITGEIDLEILKKWHKLAAKSESIDEFVSKM